MNYLKKQIDEKQKRKELRRESRKKRYLSEQSRNSSDWNSMMNQDIWKEGCVTDLESSVSPIPDSWMSSVKPFKKLQN